MGGFSMKCRSCGANIVKGTRCPICNEENLLVASPTNANATPQATSIPAPKYSTALSLATITDGFLLLAFGYPLYVLLSSSNADFITTLIVGIIFLYEAFEFTLCLFVHRKKLWAANILRNVYVIGSILSFIIMFIFGVLRFRNLEDLRDERWDDFT
jgi:hypothetical protein